jgi:dolichol-phosphate mannosyltransferase
VPVLERRQPADLVVVHAAPLPVVAVLSVVVPLWNEEAVVAALVARLRPVLDGLGRPYEVVAVDDGSTDGTPAMLAAARDAWPALRVLRLTRNHGHQVALTAGLDVARGDWVVTMDGDLQDPPETIPAMLEAAEREGVDVVYARRSDRRTDSPFKRVTAGAYYRVLRRAAKVEVPADAGDFRLVSARVVTALRALPEGHRVYRVLIPWLGFPSAVVSHPRDARAAGRTTYTVRRMAVLAADSVAAFSTAPLRVATALGLGGALLCFLLAVGAVVAYLLGHTVPGWASLTVGMLFLGAVQLLCLGVLGEYVGRILDEVRHRPPYTVESDSSAQPARDVADA